MRVFVPLNLLVAISLTGKWLHMQSCTWSAYARLSVPASCRLKMLDQVGDLRRTQSEVRQQHPGDDGASQDNTEDLDTADAKFRAAARPIGKLLANDRENGDAQTAADAEELNDDAEQPRT